MAQRCSKGTKVLSEAPIASAPPWVLGPAAFHCPDLSEVKDLEQVKQALEIAAAGDPAVPSSPGGAGPLLRPG
ncbi:hypothetical protein AALA54_11475 [Oscillospiraceae bacterium 44-34]